MANTTVDVRRRMRGPEYRRTFPIQASTKVFAGAAITKDTTGNVGVATADEQFVGFAESQIDNSSGAAALAGRDVTVHSRGVVLLAVSGAVAGDEGKAVFVSTDDQTFSYTAKAQQFVGNVEQFDISGYVWVRLAEDPNSWNTWTLLADDASYALPIQAGVVHVAAGDEGGSWAVAAAGASAKIGGSTNTAAADTDAKLCVYDAGTNAAVKNRLASGLRVNIMFRGNVPTT